LIRHGDYKSSKDVEKKIRWIGGANIHAAAQFDNLHELFKEVNAITILFNVPFI
jgi:hypothetical protein